MLERFLALSISGKVVNSTYIVREPVPRQNSASLTETKRLGRISFFFGWTLLLQKIAESGVKTLFWSSVITYYEREYFFRS